MKKGLASYAAPIKYMSNQTVDLSRSLIRGSSFNKQSLMTGDLNLTINSRNPVNEDKTFHTHLAIEVIDTGIGMDDKSKKELFTKFGTSMGYNGMNTNGLGLGLYLSKEVSSTSLNGLDLSRTWRRYHMTFSKRYRINIHSQASLRCQDQSE